MMNNASVGEASDTAVAPPQPSFGELVETSARIGVLSFGGPAGQIALMHRVYVDEKRWIDEGRYLSALNFCMLLPGPEAMQLATYIGWRLHGIAGGLVAGLLFVLPGAAVVLALSALYATFGKVPLVETLFVGVKAAVLAIVVEALLRVARRSLKTTEAWWIAAAAFAAIFFLGVPFPVIVLAAAVVGFFQLGSATGVSNAPIASARQDVTSLAGTARTIALWLAIWILPLVAVAVVFGRGHVLSEIGWFFSKLALVTFGGAYAVLAYMAQDVVQLYGWLSPGEMLDGLGLAETTPGPLILVTQFVGFLAALRAGGWGIGLLGALVTLWATFAPCFLWIFAGAPYIERLNAMLRLRGALAGVTAAVVGVILNLTVWFALHVLFARVPVTTFGPLKLYLPDWATLDAVALGLSGLAVVLLLVLHRGVLTTLAICGAAAVVIRAALG